MDVELEEVEEGVGDLGDGAVDVWTVGINVLVGVCGRVGAGEDWDFVEAPFSTPK